MKLSANFFREEFACKGASCCGHSAPIAEGLVLALQELRFQIGRPLTITSGFRCRTHNRNVKGAKNSLHTLGMAADVRPPEGMSPADLAAEAESIAAFRSGGIGLYDGWVHLDVRKNGPARWDNRTKKGA